MPERLIRTWVPIAVGWVLARLGEALLIDIDGEGLTTAVTAIVIAVYYGIVAMAERRWPAAGVLLGTTNSELDTTKPAA